MNAFLKLIEKIDDRLNPIVVKELRQAVKSKFVVSVLMFFLVLQLVVIIGIAFYAATGGSSGGRNSSEEFMAGRDAFQALNGILFGTCMLFVPLYTAIRLAGERSEVNTDLLFVTTLKPRAIIWGKFFSAIIVTFLIFSVCAPFMTFTYLLRGIDLPTIFFAIGFDFLVTVAATQVALFLACIPAVRMIKGIFLLAMLGGILMAIGGTIGMTNEMMRFGATRMLDDPEFWWSMAGVSLMGLFAVELLFVISVAMISPPTANRALPVRVSMLAIWIVSGILATILSEYLIEIEPIYAWMIVNVGLFCVLFLASVSERQHLGPRVARTIPRFGPLRIPAFLLYSGAAGGVTFSLLMIVATLAMVHNWPDPEVRVAAAVAAGAPAPVRGFIGRAAGAPRNEIAEAFDIMCILAMYTFCYGMTAMLLGLAYVGSRLKPIHTWIMTLMMVSMGSWLPFLVGFLLTNWRDRLRTDISDYWLLANPFWAAFEDSAERWPYWLFVTAWATIIVVAGARWYFDQVTSFRPYVSTKPKRVMSPSFNPEPTATAAVT